MIPNLDNVNCEICEYWWKHDIAADVGFCHRNPPVLHPLTAEWIWPRTNMNDVCGNFVEQDDEENEY